MGSPVYNESLDAIEAAPTWNERVRLIRALPERFGHAALRELHSAIAARVYVPHLTPDFGFVRWTPDYDLDAFHAAYAHAAAATKSFTEVDSGAIELAIDSQPTCLRILRLIIGFTAQEFAAATDIVASRRDATRLSVSRVKSIEAGSSPRAGESLCAALVIDLAMAGQLFGEAPPGLSAKTDKPDTANGWDTVRELAANGVPYATFLHQRLYGGSFRQLLDATSARRGSVLEDAVELQFRSFGVPYVRTTSANQREIAGRFGLAVRPAPDFIIEDRGTVRALLECKAANDGGTARDKAARFLALQQEAIRHGGAAVVAVLSGLGWGRTMDALGPVVRATDGRIFTAATLDAIVAVEPFDSLVRR